jgi:hypothetical protein
MKYNKKSVIILVVFATLLCIVLLMSHHTITIGNKPGMCENDGSIHAFIYDAYGKGQYRGNWSQVKNFLIYQHNKYGVDEVVDSVTLGDGTRPDIKYSMDEYIIMKDRQCGNGTPLNMSIDLLDPGLTPTSYPTPTVITIIPTYDYQYDGFGKAVA